jgi:sn1-specific diacylglycerol lipase
MHATCLGLCAGLVLFNWVLLALTLFGLAVVFDPLGSARFAEQELTLETLRHRKLTRLWMRRLKWTFCWMRRDKHGKDAFIHMASKYRNSAESHQKLAFIILLSVLFL